MMKTIIKQETNQTMKDLFFSIFNTKNTNELHKFVEKHPILSDSTNWVPYGGSKNNYSTFENQQSHPIPALIEKITNSIDATLIKQAKLLGIDPKGEHTPSTMSEAIERFYGVKDGSWETVDRRQRKLVSEEIQLVATGDTESPNLMIYDNGEGQHPDDFENTFLSLHKGNKIDIPFVQGKFNMGSTGAVVHTLGNRYQLIVSKRHEGLYSDTKPNQVGFTLVRRHTLTTQEEETARTTWYEYLKIDGEIPRFETATLDLGLYNRAFLSGSIVKLYSYDLPPGSRSNVTMDLWRDLNHYLYKPALPLLTCERRPKYEGKSLEKMMLGNKARIMVDDRNKREKTVALTLKSSKFGELPIEVHVFKPDVKQHEFVKEKAVVFTLNGQVQGYENRSFISQELGLHLLRDTTLIHVDTTKIKNSYRQDLFMASRDRLKENSTKKMIIDVLKKELRTNEELVDLNDERKNTLMRNKEGDEDLLKQVVSSIPMNQDLLSLLKRAGNLNINQAESMEEKKRKKRKFAKSYFPYIFECVGLKQRVLDIPENGHATLSFETDAEDEYLIRSEKPGSLFVSLQKGDIYESFDIKVEGPATGKIKVTFHPKEHVKAGERFNMSVELTSPVKDLTREFNILITPSVEKEEKKEKRERNNKKPNLPQPIKVYKESWEEYGWTGEDVVKILIDQKNEENLIQAIAINMDSDVLRNYFIKNKIKSERQVRAIKDKYFLNTYLHTMFLYGTIDKSLPAHTLQMEADEMVERMLKPYSMFLLSYNSEKSVMDALAD